MRHKMIDKLNMNILLFIGVLLINGISSSPLTTGENDNKSSCNLTVNSTHPVYRLKTLLDCIRLNIEKQWGQFDEHHQLMFEIVMVSLLQEVKKSTQEICDKKLEIDPDNLVQLENKMGLPASLHEMATPIITSILTQARDIWCDSVDQISHDLPKNATMENMKTIDWASIATKLANNLSQKILASNPDLPIILRRKRQSFSDKTKVEKTMISSGTRLFIIAIYDYVKELVKDQQRMMKNIVDGTAIDLPVIDSTKQPEDKKHPFAKILGSGSRDLVGFVSAIDFKMIKKTKQRYLKYCNTTKKSEKIPKPEAILNVLYFAFDEYFFDVLSKKFDFNETNIAEIYIFTLTKKLPSVPTIKMLMRVHDLLYNVMEKLNINAYLNEIENVGRTILKHPSNYCETLKTIQTFIKDSLDPIIENSTQEAAGGKFVAHMDKIKGWENFKQSAVSVKISYDLDDQELASRIKQKIKRSVKRQMTNKEWKAKKDEFFRNQYQLFDASNVDPHNETFQEIQKNVKGILEGFSIESGDAKTPTTLKMSKKWKPVVQRIRRASGENLTGDYYYESSEDEERLSLSQDEKIVLEEALDRIISAIINHRNELMSRTRKFISLVVHILAKSEKMEPESLSCIARAGVTFMSETRKHLNTVFKGFRNELESMKNTLWSEDSIDGSDNDETLTKLISAELMRDVEDAIAASSRTYEVNKVRLFEKFMTCKIKNSAYKK